MKIIVDVMGGDNRPEELIRGAVAAAEACGADFILAGDEKLISRTLDELAADRRRFDILGAEQYVTMEDEPTSVVKAKRNSSMALGLKALGKGEADGFVGVGNTGALFTGATVYVKPIADIRRAAIATVLPFDRPLLLLDSGANLTVTPEYLEQFAFMGEIYMSRMLGVANPEVGLLNNGAEGHKGTPTAVEAYKLLSQTKDINFVGNIEGKQVPLGACDVLVTDGFTGNILLKYTEGMGAFMLTKLRGIFMSNFITKLSAVLIKKNIHSLKKSFSSSEYGGAPFLGISKPVIKAHGNADAEAVKNAVLQCVRYAESGLIDEIAQKAEKYGLKKD